MTLSRGRPRRYRGKHRRGKAREEWAFDLSAYERFVRSEMGNRQCVVVYDGYEHVHAASGFAASPSTGEGGMTRAAFFHACPSAPCVCFQAQPCPDCGVPMEVVEGSYWDNDGEVIQYVRVCSMHGVAP